LLSTLRIFKRASDIPAAEGEIGTPPVNGDVLSMDADRLCVVQEPVTLGRLTVDVGTLLASFSLIDRSGVACLLGVTAPEENKFLCDDPAGGYVGLAPEYDARLYRTPAGSNEYPAWYDRGVGDGNPRLPL
jgi:hypothetical protein